MISCRGSSFGKPGIAPPSAPVIDTVTPAFTVAPAFTITPTFTPSPIPTATWVYQGPGNIVVPILLYHHVDSSRPYSQYYVSVENFESQMRLLHDWEYTTITIEMLVKAIQEGTALPPRPIMITFDDGNLDNYTNAFPIMQRYGDSGVLYVVGTYIGAPQYMDVGQIKEVARAGWEIGSHGMTHPDLERLDLQMQNYEIVDSRGYLENKLGLPILTFAYPFGVSSCGVNNKVYKAGYIAGMSIGTTPDQCQSELFNLHRLAVKGMYGLNKFASLLPWRGDPIFLPTETPTLVNTPAPSQ